MNPESAKERTYKGVINVHFAGQPNKLYGFRHNLLIEDACHALGAEVRKNGQWRKIGGTGVAAATVFSFHPVKHITTGEGGMVVTDDKKIYDELRLLRSHGMQRDPGQLENSSEGPWYYEVQKLGFNYRLSDIHCALGLSQLKRLDRFIEKRRKIAAYYDRAFGSIEGIRIPAAVKDTRSSYHLYILQIDFEFFKTNRKSFVDHLYQKGIGTQVHYIPLYRQPLYRNEGLRCDKALYPETEAVVDTSMLRVVPHASR
jgi:dTDP-4-amino-4,6-dideoxygalactose transaminase